MVINFGLDAKVPCLLTQFYPFVYELLLRLHRLRPFHD